MKIVEISTGIYTAPPSGYAGLELIAGLLAQEFDKQGHEVYLMAPEGSYVPKNGELLSIGKEKELGEQQAFEKHKERLLELTKEGVIIHDHTWAKFGYKLKNDYPEAKICSTVHGMVPYKSAPCEKMNLICCSQTQALIYTQSMNYGNKSVDARYVHHGIDLNAYKYNEDKEDFFFFLSRIFPPKGAHLAIQLCNKFKKKLKVAGGSFGDDKVYTDFIKHICDKSDYCEFLGEIDFQTKVDLYSRAKALLVPLIPYAIWGGTETSVWVEIFGLFMPEALASGTPVITTYCGATPEIIENYKSGFLCIGIEDLEYAITHVETINPKDCLQRAQYFNKKRMAQDYLDLFQSILDGKEW